MCLLSRQSTSPSRSPTTTTTTIVAPPQWVLGAAASIPVQKQGKLGMPIRKHRRINQTAGKLKAKSRTCIANGPGLCPERSNYGPSQFWVRGGGTDSAVRRTTNTTYMIHVCFKSMHHASCINSLRNTDYYGYSDPF